MTSSSVSIPISKITNQMTLKVDIKGLAAYRVRAWVATALVTMAAKVAGVKCDIEDQQQITVPKLDLNRLDSRDVSMDMAKIAKAEIFKNIRSGEFRK